MNPATRSYRAMIDRLEQDQSLYEETHFIPRMNALDMLELHTLSDTNLTTAEKSGLIQRTEAIIQKLSEANEALFAHLLFDIRSGDCLTVKQAFHEAERQISRSADDDNLGYDELDMLLSGLLEVDAIPAETEERAADMVFYQPTPVRIILKIIDQLQPFSEDIFYDLGSGLGHVPVLVNLLTGIRTRGVELEASYVHYADECLKKLGLAEVAFIHADARQVDYNDGTLFYLYTPFQGEMLQQVLRILEAQSKRRPIKVCAYGPCMVEVGKQPWLQSIYQTGKGEGSLGVFECKYWSQRWAAEEDDRA